MGNTRAALNLVVCGIFTVLTAPARADWAVNMPKGVTELSREIYDLHMIIFWICVIIGAGVFGVMFWSIVHHRKSRGAKAANFHENHVVEIVWTVIPFLILVGMAVPATRTLIKMEDTSGTEMTVKVTGYQWMWHYDYLDNDIAFYSRLDAASNAARQLDSDTDPREVPDYLLNVDNPLVLPVDTKIRILTTAGDVIHAWWVPELGGKKDAIPGYINEMWVNIDEPGTYRGQCAELCGKDHGFMPIVVKAVSKEAYREWVAEQGGQTGQQTASL
jgi:cytochrome c oxidase subunit 2